MSIDYEIFEGKTLSSLLKDVYDNTIYNRKQLDILTHNISFNFITLLISKLH